MATQPKDEGQTAAEAEDLVSKALQQLRFRPTPLTADELASLRDIIADWRYRQRRESERKRNWPLLALLVSFATTALGWLVSFLSNHWPFPGGK